MNKEIDKAGIITIIVMDLLLCIGSVIIGYNIAYNKYKASIQPPIENIQQSVDSVKIIVKQLDKEKNEKIIEVKGLSNDSTLELFRRLTRE